MYLIGRSSYVWQYFSRDNINNMPSINITTICNNKIFKMISGKKKYCTSCFRYTNFILPFEMLYVYVKVYDLSIIQIL